MMTFVPALEGLLTAAKAMASFDAFRKQRKGDARALVEELKANSRLCFRVVEDGVAVTAVISHFSTAEFDRLNKAGFNFNVLKNRRIHAYSGIDQSDLAAWPGKTTASLVDSIYDKIKTLQSIHHFKPGHPQLRRRIINIHKRILLLLRHAQGE